MMDPGLILIFRGAIYKQNGSVKKHMTTLKIKIKPGFRISIIKNL